MTQLLTRIPRARSPLNSRPLTCPGYSDSFQPGLSCTGQHYRCSRTNTQGFFNKRHASCCEKELSCKEMELSSRHLSLGACIIPDNHKAPNCLFLKEDKAQQSHLQCATAEMKIARGHLPVSSALANTPNCQREVTGSATIFSTSFLPFSLKSIFSPLRFFVDKMKKNEYLICNLFVQGGTKSLRSLRSYLSGDTVHIT